MINADFITEDMKLAVKSGAHWLDEEHPDWAQKINLGILEMASCVNCIVGQTIGHYYDLFTVGVDRSDNWSADHGFMIPWTSDECDTDPDYRKLETLWTEEVKKRLW